MGASAKLKKLFWNALFRNVPRSRCISGPLDEGVSKWEQEFLTYLSEHPKLHRVLTPASLKAWRNCISSPTQAVEGSRKGSRGRGKGPGRWDPPGQQWIDVLKRMENSTLILPLREDHYVGPQVHS